MQKAGIADVDPIEESLALRRRMGGKFTEAVKAAKEIAPKEVCFALREIRYERLRASQEQPASTVRSSIEQIDLLLGIAGCHVSRASSHSLKDTFSRNLRSAEGYDLKQALSRQCGLTPSPEELLPDTAESVKEEGEDTVVVAARQRGTA